MSQKIHQLLEGTRFQTQNHEFELSIEIITLLHHWNFGTSASYYRSKNKSLILPDVHGRLVKITNIEETLDSAFHAYNTKMESLFLETNDVETEFPC